MSNIQRRLTGNPPEILIAAGPAEISLTSRKFDADSGPVTVDFGRSS